MGENGRFPPTLIFCIIYPMIDTTDKTRLISLAEAADLYGFSRNYLNNLVSRGRLEASKVGSMWVTTPQDMENFIASRQKRGVFRKDIESKIDNR